MRLYFDQMLRVDLAVRLRETGHDVVRASEVGQARADDSEVLARASSEQRILVTLDAHFGDWAVLPLGRHCGVIRIRIHPTTSGNIASLLVPFLSTHQTVDFGNQLVILSRRGVRWINTAR